MSTTPQHWAAQYIGRPWQSGGRGPESFDCWGLIRWVYLHHYGIELPEFIGVDSEDQLEVRRQMLNGERSARNLFPDWESTLSPVDGVAVALGAHDVFYHVGIYLELPEGGRVLHCRKGQGVTHHTITALRSEGLNRIAFYQHGLRR